MIRQAAHAVGVAPQTIRKWEREGLIRIGRGANGFRYFLPQDVERLKLVKQLLGRGVRVDAVRSMLEPSSGPEGVAQGQAQLPRTLEHLRVERGLTVDEVGRRVGLSPGRLRALERGRSNGSIEVLQRLATLYGVTLIDIVTGGEAERSHVVLARERPVLMTSGEGVVIEGLAQGQLGLRPLLLTIAPGEGVRTFHHHSGEEFVFMLSGHLEITLENGEVCQLGPGDSIALSSELPHRWVAVDSTARALWVHRDRDEALSNVPGREEVDDPSGKGMA